MRAALVTGLRVAGRCLPLVVLLWQVNLVFGAIFAGLSATALNVNLGDSSYSKSLLTDLDLTAFFALYAHAGPTWKLLGASAVTLAVLYLVTWLGLHAATVTAVWRSDEVTTGSAIRAGASLTPLFFRVFCLAAPTTGIALAAVGVATRWGMALARNAAAEGAWEAILVSGLACGGVLLVLGTAIHDHARLRCVAAEEGAWQSYAWAVRFVLRGWRPYALALAMQSVGIGLWAVYQAAAALIATNWMTGVVIALVWGELFMAARMVLRVWAFAAQAQLQDG